MKQESSVQEPKQQSNRAQLLIGTFFISLSALLFELILIRVFSVMLFSNFAFLGISIALFGLACGGIIVYARPKHFSSDSFWKRLGQYSTAFALTIIVFFLIFIQFNYAQLHPLLLLLIFILAAAPFIFVNICLSLLFTKRNERIHTIYFFDLLGAAAGVAAAALLLNVVDIVGAVFIAAGVAAASAICFSYKQKKLFFLAWASLFIILCSYITSHYTSLFDITFTKIGKEYNIIFEQWNSFSRITVEDIKVYLFLEKIPEEIDETMKRYGIRIDADAYTPIFEFNGDLSTMEWLRTDFAAIAYHIIDGDTSLVIGPGGGRDLITALLFDKKVTGVEINPIIANDVMRGEFQEFSGNIYGHPDVHIEVEDGRSYLTRTTDKYNVISLPLVDTWASTAAGSLYLVENYLYTVEAFEEYLTHLEDGGVFTVTRWELDGLRLVSVYEEASQRLGLDPKDNMLIITNGTEGKYQLNNYLFKTTPFTEQEIERAEQFVKENDMEILYAPDREIDNDYYSFIKAPDRDAFINSYIKDVSPVTDDHPFFFFQTPLRQLLNPSFAEKRSNDGGLIVALVLVATCSILCVILPWLLFSKQYKLSSVSSGVLRAAFLSYFILLGFAFLFIEIVFIQKFILYLEHPFYSYSVILAAMLLFAGIGSIVSKSVYNKGKKGVLATGGFIVLYTVLFVLLSQFIIMGTITLPIIAKIAIASLIVAPLSVGMGMMLPMGIRQTSAHKCDVLIPWCWALNGAASVLCSVLAVFFSIIFSFSAVLIIAAILYAVATVILYKTIEVKQ